MKHYSQFGEDRVLEHVFPGASGFFVDVGAHNGITDSNTKMLEDKGWVGVCIEPHSVFYKALEGNRTATCFNVVAWHQRMAQIEFHETGPGGWSRVEGGGKFRTQRITYPRADTLDNILSSIHHIDFISIDVEGHENHVLAGWTLNRTKPRVVLIEDLSHRGQYDSYFEGYHATYGWKQGKPGSNVWYCREIGDHEIVRKRYR